MKTIMCQCGEKLRYQELYNGIQLTIQFAADCCPKCKIKPVFGYLMRLRERSQKC